MATCTRNSWNNNVIRVLTGGELFVVLYYKTYKSSRKLYCHIIDICIVYLISNMLHSFPFSNDAGWMPLLFLYCPIFISLEVYMLVCTTCVSSPTTYVMFVTLRNEYLFSSTNDAMSKVPSASNDRELRRVMVMSDVPLLGQTGSLQRHAAPLEARVQNR